MIATAPLAIELKPAPFPEVAAQALSALPGLVFLDSSGADHDRGRYSYLMADPFLMLSSRGNRARLTSKGQVQELTGDPFALLQGLLRQYRCERLNRPIPFQGAVAGYWGYDLGRQVESLPATAVDDLGLPELLVGFYDWAIVWDHLLQKAWLCATGLPEGSASAAQRRLDQIGLLLEQRPSPLAPAPSQVWLKSNFRRSDYLRAVERVLDYIAAGDVYQVNLSQRFTGPWLGDAWPLYRTLRAISPVPYGAYLDFGDVAVLSASPECFLRLAGDRVETYPIKGTRPRGATPEADARLEAELFRSEKDRAENLMIVDLLRNDLGKVCSIGSIQVPHLFRLEKYSHVWQMVSSVTGSLRPGLDAVDLLRSCFPGGSVTGCPKIRAMEIIEELEQVRRGPYCGAIGNIGFDGDMTTSIVIRTLVLHRGQVHLQVGGGIVADSDPEQEYLETLDKAAALVEALHGDIEEER